ncbi:hypothetical protein [Conexibacter arvalis]|uniref:Uncharacterized protein n=1 Tax=Conexibacter arvalis TaxID=912552 RepID=A0A840IE32_9ACTN|nr:hypothetical protein [Conexibacter arvalis]MBB4662483.1 hypothetical protein [Conexibacter arvalis]
MTTVAPHPIWSSGTPVSSVSGMAAILTPALALRYLRQLSTDVRAAVVLDGEGRPLAGEAAIAAPAVRLAELMPAGATELVVRVGAGGEARGTALAARVPAPADAPAASPNALVLAVGPLALLDLLRLDVDAALGALAGAPAERPAPPPLPPGAVVAHDPSSGVQALEPPGFAVQTAISAGMGLFDAVAAATPGAGE